MIFFENQCKNIPGSCSISRSKRIHCQSSAPICTLSFRKAEFACQQKTLSQTLVLDGDYIWRVTQFETVILIFNPILYIRIIWKAFNNWQNHMYPEPESEEKGDWMCWSTFTSQLKHNICIIAVCFHSSVFYLISQYKINTGSTCPL